MPFAIEFLDNAVIIGIVLKAPAGVYRARYAEAVHLPHEVARGVFLVFVRELWTHGKGRVEYCGIRPCNEHSGGVSPGVFLNFCSWQCRSVAGVPRSP